LILEVGSGRQAAARLAVVRDQERIARDLHDTVIQRPFGVGLSLPAAAGLTSGAVSERLMAAIDSLDETIRKIRTVIIGLDRPRLRDADHSLRADVLDVCAEAARALGFEPAVRFDGPIDAAIPAGPAADVVNVIREALSNVARHAHASSAAVHLAVRDGRVTLTVVDDGRGIALAQRRGGNGVDNMSSRAARHGGALERSKREFGGTRVTWTIHLG
jgi:signal transduction histidine kinase